ncbi:Fur family transcriptional regulator [Chelatococcus reniformis]|uniref:Ferric uptake regulation protein n=1 Tax=Chelatococcus reniformis TaxID=1494448 RepID=A0A916UXU4_9HYPH|nr:Fur family transcriptional regulator [Chelatococcus reniformis]GGC93020.1 hypothetical protein GCM10010994_58540 [Chelatococcus reniformis]
MTIIDRKPSRDGRRQAKAEVRGHAAHAPADRASAAPAHAAHAHDAGACAHAAERAREAPQALALADEICRERGVRLTDLRRSVLEALYDTHRPLGAYDLAEVLAGRTRKRIAPITIYRVLEFLTEQGFVHRLATKNAFVACPHAHAPGEMNVFLICEACGGVDEATSPQVAGAVGAVIAAHRFAPRGQVLEIEGLCAHCRPR